MEELASTENYIAFTRQAYNNTDIFYNDKVREQFPTVLFSGIFGFGLAEY
ncbi:MAG: LemA family protein [Candidatus Adiutrix intracellularis]|jgi:LemA protein|nr:LemA family protein [Candidatus Adiutrix intracellularis]